MEELSYFLCRSALGAPEKIPITKEQYEALLICRNCLTELRKLFAESKVAAEKEIEYWRERWTNRFGNLSLIGVGASKYSGEDVDLDAKRAFIGPQIDEYRQSLEAKTATLTNMICRRIGLYSEHERKKKVRS